MKLTKKKKKKNNYEHAKYIITHEFNRLMADNFAARLAQLKLATKDDVADFVIKVTDFDNKLKNLNKNVTSNKTKLVSIETEVNEFSEKFN